MSISKIFISNFVCVLTNERYKTYQIGFHSVAWVMPKGSDLGALGVTLNHKFCVSIRMRPIHRSQFGKQNTGILTYTIIKIKITLSCKIIKMLKTT